MPKQRAPKGRVKTTPQCPECGMGGISLRPDGTLRRHRDMAGDPCPAFGVEPRQTPVLLGRGKVAYHFD